MPEKHTAETLLAAMKRNWPEAATPVSEMMMRVYRLNDLVRENARRQTERHGLGWTEFEVLMSLRSVGPPHELVPTELYQGLLISSGGLTKVLRGLEERGLIMRDRAQADKRNKPVLLTAAGRTKAERTMADVLESDSKLLMSGLDETEVKRLTGLVRKLLRALESDEK